MHSKGVPPQGSDERGGRSSVTVLYLVNPPWLTFAGERHRRQWKILLKTCQPSNKSWFDQSLSCLENLQNPRISEHLKIEILELISQFSPLHLISSPSPQVDPCWKSLSKTPLSRRHSAASPFSHLDNIAFRYPSNRCVIHTLLSLHSPLPSSAAVFGATGPRPAIWQWLQRRQTVVMHQTLKSPSKSRLPAMGTTRSPWQKQPQFWI